MKIPKRGTRPATTQRCEQIGHHVGPAGLRSFARDIADYEVSGTNECTSQGGLWKAAFIAGDMLSVVAGQRGGGPLEIAIFDDLEQALVLSKCPGGVCHAGTKLPRTGEYTVRVRRLRPLRTDGLSGEVMGDARRTTTVSQHGPVPFKLSRTREMPRRLRARMSPRRRHSRPRYVTSPTRRALTQLASRLGALCERLPYRAHHGSPEAA